jgi:carboxymethylenebutenolidase
MTRIAKVFTALALFAGGTSAGVLLASRVQDSPSVEPTTHGEWVAYANASGDTVRAYVAYPERQGKAPAIIVIHEIFGLTDWETSVADAYAAKGYVAITPDLLSSRYGSTRALGDSARRIVGTLTPAGVNADLDATWRYINAQPATATDNIGTIGFCWGGGTVWNYAAHNPRLKAAVVCYGPLADTTMLARVQAPVLGVYGQNDGRVNNSLPAIARIMQGLGKSFVADSYAGTGHGFLKPGRQGHGTAEAERAQREIDAFFKAKLGS